MALFGKDALVVRGEVRHCVVWQTQVGFVEVRMLWLGLVNSGKAR